MKQSDDIMGILKEFKSIFPELSFIAKLDEQTKKWYIIINDFFVYMSDEFKECSNILTEIFGNVFYCCCTTNISINNVKQNKLEGFVWI